MRSASALQPVGVYQNSDGVGSSISRAARRLLRGWLCEWTSTVPSFSAWLCVWGVRVWGVRVWGVREPPTWPLSPVRNSRSTAGPWSATRLSSKASAHVRRIARSSWQRWLSTSGARCAAPMRKLCACSFGRFATAGTRSYNRRTSDHRATRTHRLPASLTSILYVAYGVSMFSVCTVGSETLIRRREREGVAGGVAVVITTVVVIKTP